jgi:hypothetical protein
MREQEKRKRRLIWKDNNANAICKHNLSSITEE